MKLPWNNVPAEAPAACRCRCRIARRSRCPGLRCAADRVRGAPSRRSRRARSRGRSCRRPWCRSSCPDQRSAAARGVDLEAVEVARDHVPGPAVRAADDIPGPRSIGIPSPALAGPRPVGRGADQVAQDHVAGRVVLDCRDDLDPVGRVARDQVALPASNAADRVRRRADDQQAVLHSGRPPCPPVGAHRIALDDVAAAPLEDDTRPRKSDDHEPLDRGWYLRRAPARRHRPGL